MAISLGVPVDDRLAVPTRCVEGWAQIAVGLLAAAGEQVREQCEIHEDLRNDEESPAVARKWDDRHSFNSRHAKADAAKARVGAAEEARGALQARLDAMAVDFSQPISQRVRQRSGECTAHTWIVVVAIDGERARRTHR